MDTRKRLTIIINCIIAVNTIIIAIIGILYGAGDGQLGNYIVGLGYFKPYTMDSNILTGLVAFIVIVYSIKNAGTDKKIFPRWLIRAHLMGTTSLLLIFLIATLFLAPMQVMAGRNYFVMFSDDMFFFHFLNPLLATISLITLPKDYIFSFADRFIGMFPTIVYSIVYFVMVVLLKWWDDFYHFTLGGNYFLVPIVFVIIYGVAYMCSYMLIRVHNYFVNSYYDK